MNVKYSKSMLKSTGNLATGEMHTTEAVSVAKCLALHELQRPISVARQHDTHVTRTQDEDLHVVNTIRGLVPFLDMREHLIFGQKPHIPGPPS